MTWLLDLTIRIVAEDLSTYDPSALRLAREVDPGGERTLGVLTKCDRPATSGALSDLVRGARTTRTKMLDLKYGWHRTRAASLLATLDGLLARITQTR